MTMRCALTLDVLSLITISLPSQQQSQRNTSSSFPAASLARASDADAMRRAWPRLARDFRLRNSRARTSHDVISARRRFISPLEIMPHCTAIYAERATRLPRPHRFSARAYGAMQRCANYFASMAADGASPRAMPLSLFVISPRSLHIGRRFSRLGAAALRREMARSDALSPPLGLPAAQAFFTRAADISMMVIERRSRL